MAAKEQANPIINSPYERPRYHWELDGDGRATDTLLDGRRPSGPYRGVPLPAGSHEHAGYDDSIEPYARINAIRDGVASWRKGGYRGASKMSRRLLEHWSRDAGGGERRPFFCQVDAIETLVWLCEALPSLAGRGGVGGQASRRSLLDALSLANKTWNDSVPRLAVKMATGTGKTWVMAMIILWQALLSKGRTDILILTPNLTVRDRLSELDPRLSDMSLYRELLPPDVPVPPRLHVTVINYQAFHRRSELSINGPDETPSGQAKALLSPHGRPGPARWIETDEKMLDRLLPSHRGASKITVINDEAHHCRRRRASREDAGGGSEDEDDAEAALWFGLLLSLKDQGRLGQVFDLSATPMYLKRPVELDSEVFPWTVSDYSLIDAIEAGLVKIPTVPVRDNAEPTRDRLPVWRNVYASLTASDRRVKHDRMPPVVEELLDRIHESYNKADKVYSKSKITPVMIVVVNSVKVANEFYRHIAGYVERENGMTGAGSKAWHPGSYRLFSNVEADGSGPVAHPPTLLVHSQLDKPAEGSEWKKVADVQREFFSPRDTPTRRELVDHIRKAFNTVGQAGQPGEHVRCIVSVSMLSEGWDVRTVTHIFGFRPFGSQLLCEQVAGRALRRTSLRPSAGGAMLPEYARIFGVPFSFMNEGPDRPPTPVDEWAVRTVKGRSRYRIGFPCIASYLLEQPSAVYRLDPERVGRYEATRANTPTWTEVAGPAGDTATFLVKYGKNQVLYNIANRVLAKFRDGAGASAGLERRRTMFASAVLAARRWLAHDAVRCDDIGILAHDPHRERVPEEIAAACVPVGGKASLVPLFADEYDSSRPRMTDTSAVHFKTRLERRYPARGNTAHSELNAAACHTGPELVLASVLDRHPEVVAWARNYRLGWNVPYLDEECGRWRMYEPDFVARIRDGSSGPRHLVIEFKGRMDDDAVTKKTYMEEMWIPTTNLSNDPACAGTWRYVLFDSSNDAEAMSSILHRIAEGAW